MSKIKDIIIEFNVTGVCNVDIDLLTKKWNRLWNISQWSKEYRLIKFKQKNSSVTTMKINISEEQAIEIINKLDLYQEPSLFKSGSTWKTKKPY